MRFPDEPQRRRKSSDFVAAEEAGALFQEAAPLVGRQIDAPELMAPDSLYSIVPR